MRLLGTLVLVVLCAAAFGVLLAAFGAGEVSPVNLGIIGVPGVVLGLASGMVNRPNGNRKNVARGGIDGAILCAVAAFFGGVALTLVALGGAREILQGVPGDLGEALIRGAVLPAGIYLVIGLVFGIIGAGLRGLLRR